MAVVLGRGGTGGGLAEVQCWERGRGMEGVVGKRSDVKHVLWGDVGSMLHARSNGTRNRRVGEIRGACGAFPYWLMAWRRGATFGVRGVLAIAVVERLGLAPVSKTGRFLRGADYLPFSSALGLHF